MGQNKLQTIKIFILTARQNKQKQLKYKAIRFVIDIRCFVVFYDKRKYRNGIKKQANEKLVFEIKQK